MSKREPYKKIITKLESSLESIEKEISEMSDSMIEQSGEVIRDVVSTMFERIIPSNRNLTPNQSSKEESRQDKITRLTNELEEVKSKIESTRQTYSIPYQEQKLNDSDKSSKEVEEVMRAIFSLLKRVKEANVALKAKDLLGTNSSDTAKGNKSIPKSKKNSLWKDQDIPTIRFDD